MAITYPVIKWPFTLAARKVRFEETLGAGFDDRELPNVTYVMSGDGGVAPQDFCDALKDEFEAAYLAIYAAAATGVVVTLDTAGRLTILHTSANDIDIAWDDAATTLDKAIVGETGSTVTYQSGVTHTGADLAHYQWHSADPPFFDSWEAAGKLRSQSETRNMEPHVVEHAENDHYIRVIEHQQVAAARIYDGAAAVPGYAAFASLTTGESQTFEAFLRYLGEDETTAPSPSQFYVYSTNDPATAVQAGLYKSTRNDSQDLQGFRLDSVRRDSGVPLYPLNLRLWRG
jgi:hypothetical protein